MSAGSAPIRFGLIGVDSPHAPSFTSLFGDGIDGAVPGGTVTHAWKGEAAADFPLSFERIDGFEQQVIDLGVSMCASPEEVAQVCDALLIVASDTRTHRAYFDRVVGFGKPIYVDTRFATTLDDARSMLAAAQASGALVLAGSPKRFTPEFASAVAAGPAERSFTHRSVADPARDTPAWPGTASTWWIWPLQRWAPTPIWPGPSSSRVEMRPAGALASPSGVDGRVTDLGGEDQWSAFTAGVLERADGNAEFSIEAGPPMLVGLLEGLVASCLGGTPNVPPADILGIVAIVQAANQSLDTGRPVSLGSLT